MLEKNNNSPPTSWLRTALLTAVVISLAGCQSLLESDAGGGGITKREVVLNPFSVRPGDLINNREIQNSKRPLRASKVFATGGTTGGPPPRIVVRPPELKELQRFAERTGVSGGSGGGSLGSQGSTSRF